MTAQPPEKPLVGVFDIVSASDPISPSAYIDYCNTNERLPPNADGSGSAVLHTTQRLILGERRFHCV